MITGSCLCGGIAFEIERAVGPFELCHCRRCRKASGSAFAAAVGVRTADFRLLRGADLIATYDAPILHVPPAYRVSFCRRCGSPVPNPDRAHWFEIPAGLLDVDPGLRPDKHIFVELAAPWYALTDELPQLTREELIEWRRRRADASPPRIIRPSPADAPALTRIAHAAKQQWGYSDELMRLWSADLTVTPEFLAEHGVYAIERAGRIVGFCALAREGNTIELEHMWIDPSEMRSGLGTLLFEHAVAEARALGGETLRIVSDPNAEGFYIRMGARRTGEAPSTPPGRVLPVLEVDLNDVKREA